MGLFNINELWVNDSIFSLTLVSSFDQNSVVPLCSIYMSKYSPRISQGFGRTHFGENKITIFNPYFFFFISSLADLGDK